MNDGRILASGSQLRSAYLTPRGIFGYAVEWTLLTREDEARVILSYYPAQKF